MTEGKTTQEPTMEEILASIRRIISEDDKDAVPPTNGNGKANGNGQLDTPPADEDEEDLVLTDMVVGDGNVVAIDEDDSMLARFLLNSGDGLQSPKTR